MVVTPLQLLAAYSAVANDGLWVRPTILRRARPAKTSRVLKPETALEMRRLLESCVLNGTGKPAKVRGYSLGGKTGSAQKADGKLGYRSDRFIASFAGLAPIKKPRLAILVTIDEPQGSHWGAVSAAPVFREVARQALMTLRIPPDTPGDLRDGASHGSWKVAARP